MCFFFYCWSNHKFRKGYKCWLYGYRWCQRLFNIACVCALAIVWRRFQPNLRKHTHTPFLSCCGKRSADSIQMLFIDNYARRLFFCFYQLLGYPWHCIAIDHFHLSLIFVALSKLSMASDCYPWRFNSKCRFFFFLLLLHIPFCVCNALISGNTHNRKRRQSTSTFVCFFFFFIVSVCAKFVYSYLKGM